MSLRAPLTVCSYRGNQTDNVQRTVPRICFHIKATRNNRQLHVGRERATKEEWTPTSNTSVANRAIPSTNRRCAGLTGQHEHVPEWTLWCRTRSDCCTAEYEHAGSGHGKGFKPAEKSTRTVLDFRLRWRMTLFIKLALAQQPPKTKTLSNVALCIQFHNQFIKWLSFEFITRKASCIVALRRRALLFFDGAQCMYAMAMAPKYK